MRMALQGRLTGAQVEELKTSWKTASQLLKGRTCKVDIDQLAFIDKRGSRGLRAMVPRGCAIHRKRSLHEERGGGVEIPRWVRTVRNDRVVLTAITPMNFELRTNKCEGPNPGTGELKRRETHAEPPPSI